MVKEILLEAWKEKKDTLKLEEEYKVSLNLVNGVKWNAWRVDFGTSDKAKVRWAQEFKKSKAYSEKPGILVTSKEESLEGKKPEKALNTKPNGG